MSDLHAAAVFTPWYHRDPWPLLPRWWYLPENEQNKADWGFSWLFLSVWTGIALNLGLHVELAGDGLRIQIHVPFLHVRISPLPFPHRWHQWGWRVKPWPQLSEAEQQANRKPRLVS